MLLTLAALLAVAGGAGAGVEAGAEAEADAARVSGRGEVRGARGGSATLLCDVHNAMDEQVSWVRSRDLQILSHGGVVFTSDGRVSTGVRVGRTHTHWLRVSELRDSDAGAYECQLNTEPKRSFFVQLLVRDPTVEVVTDAAPTLVQHTATTAESRRDAGGLAPQHDAMQRDQAADSGAARHRAAHRLLLLLLLLAALARH